ncbi:MAG: amidohydrolase family protein [Nitrospiraceae bacterium]|nr:amidohydrolase family protein [Nitrospiraceae bacterium]
MTVMPGLIDSHCHLLGLSSFAPLAVMTEHYSLRAARAVADARRLLLAGFTSIRCAGSDLSIGIKQAIEEGSIPGPRIFAANQIISQTGGHGDLHLFPLETVREHVPFFRIADGVEDCRRAVREQVRAGADHIKICTSGGVSSERDSPHHQQFSMAEIRTIVDEAHQCGRRVMSHAQGLAGIRAAVESGVDSIEHGIYLDEQLIAKMKRQSIVLVPTFSVFEVFLENASEFGVTKAIVDKAREVTERYADSVRQAFKGGVTIALGTDFIGGRWLAHGKNALELELLTKRGLPPLAAIRAATVNGSKALGMDRHLGCLRKGALADIIVVDGDPADDISLLQDGRRMVLVIKNGRVEVASRELSLPPLPNIPLMKP